MQNQLVGVKSSTRPLIIENKTQTDHRHLSKYGGDIYFTSINNHKSTNINYENELKKLMRGFAHGDDSSLTIEEFIDMLNEVWMCFDEQNKLSSAQIAQILVAATGNPEAKEINSQEVRKMIIFSADKTQNEDSKNKK